MGGGGALDALDGWTGAKARSDHAANPKTRQSLIASRAEQTERTERNGTNRIEYELWTTAITRTARERLVFCLSLVFTVQVERCWCWCWWLPLLRFAPKDQHRPLAPSTIPPRPYFGQNRCHTYLWTSSGCGSSAQHGCLPLGNVANRW